VPKPIPIGDDVSAFYWEAAKGGRLEMQRCAKCQHWQFPPSIACQRCQSEEVVATEVSGLGTVYSFTIAQQAFDPAFAEEIPYVVALIELEEDPELRVLSNVVGVAPEEVTVGLPVAVEFEQRGDAALPVFRPC
jgi:uncharacterized protein